MEQTIEKSIEEKMEHLITQSLEKILEKNIELILDTKLDSYLGKKLGFSPYKNLDETIAQHNELTAKEWLNVQETCDYIGISYKGLQRLIDQGLKFTSIGRSKRFSITEINHFLKIVQA
ncbi:helix-turn-helix domain-containing protein [Lysinibacillus sp. A4]|uniref:helix-turn-helix domain-containing protein n=1 Tax=unclassified Lysinibacillus TaxID=2636778 RepID=UPI002175DD4F|nr:MULTISPECIES: helix-turn-helix domain-containing protein [unclassified Lysinibacillus]MCS5503516.1 helix-turn-helix domain-containing protein [Lysinibacillus sp. A4]WGT39270.1 helix-turn-helix domain-containing protein [Lysinibacillus sp. 1 U-2021]